VCLVLGPVSLLHKEMMGVLGSLVDGGVVNSKGFEDNGRAGNNLLQ
jgi:hypothetical protein